MSVFIKGETRIMDDTRSRNLVVQLLRYFQTGHTIARLSVDRADFPGYTGDELRDAARGLIAAGFVVRARGRTRAATYLVSEDGRVTLAALEELED